MMKHRATHHERLGPLSCLQKSMCVDKALTQVSAELAAKQSACHILLPQLWQIMQHKDTDKSVQELSPVCTGAGFLTAAG